ncbi:uncharacterized protein L3040_004591 [Drepanopeziza brunnea f. sp. 'multigermtubi']|uniref:Gastric mucin-like protein n=1 Tax=Marssonina brunnea f. sp. multigermtubi (strain MB_m1) TaxID=1072389 RepID=K1X791_MARBU|nr:uncharacterized protein MBM_00085 [Drepanopeziza brunnea f. sp. 'multigermtubi' MB_m1]EKD20972.1 hypothetical protein MBM_00085 [Drepanopeziza brunnea f. sp. 'multigermtubi' MB_m1]KAJ5042031.1 hypothetical protein L3040_004591 [Drepanopeziza brunnea f. sp. 'multigermtubi']
MEMRKNGYFIVLEGDTNIISTQLRLLPPSQKILILPNLLESQSPTDENDAFNARTFVQVLQTALSQRTETARSFLQSATPTQPRLVLAVHGSVSARATCISMISQKVTHGNVAQAEAILNDLVRGGVAGLVKKGEVKPVEDLVQTTGDLDDGNIHDSKEKLARTSSKAWEIKGPEPRLAPLTYERSGWERESSRLIPPQSLVLEHPTQIIFKLTESYPTIDKDSRIVWTVLNVPNRRELSHLKTRMPFGFPPEGAKLDWIAQELNAPMGDTDTEADEGPYSTNGPISPADSMTSLLMTPAVIGEACVVNIQKSSQFDTSGKAQSADGFRPFWFESSEPRSQSLEQTRSQCQLRDEPQSSTASYMGSKEKQSFPSLPTATSRKASKTTIIIKSPTSARTTSLRSPRSSKSSVSEIEMTEQMAAAEEVAITESEEVPFVAVFELVEDIIIHFVDDTPNEIFESVVQSYKTGSYPAYVSTTTIPESSSSTPTTTEDEDEEYKPSVKALSTSSLQQDVERDIRPSSYVTSTSVDIGDKKSQQEYDPFAVNDSINSSYPSVFKQQWSSNGHLRIHSTSETDSSVKPPKPPLLLTQEIDNEIAKKFVHFSPANPDSAISVQNSFRQLLDVYFPSKENYSQYYYAAAPEADRLWKPVFGNDETSTISNERGTVDQILAFGREEGVQKDFFYQISGRIEKLGTKKDGLNLSGRIDIRYLISRVMQMHINGPPADESASPLLDPELLAALLIPHLEAYLANNATIRLLILHYTAADLPIVFALRKLLGTDIFKISGILDCLASDPPPTSQPRTSSSRPRSPVSSVLPVSPESITRRQQQHTRLSSMKTLCHQASNSLNKHHSQTSTFVNSPTVAAQAKAPTASFAKANYLLPSTATDQEITTFISNIRKSLMDISDFYTPEPELKPISIERHPIPPRTVSPLEPINRDSGYPTSSYAGSPSEFSRPTGSDAPTSHAGSLFSTTPGDIAHANNSAYTASIESSNARSSNHHKYEAIVASEKERKDKKQWEDFYIAEDDSDDDEYDKMTLGRAHQRIVPEVGKVGEKRPTKKALKWLGLS